jgi:hypothetical protein
METHIPGRHSHAYTPFCCWFIYLTTIVRNMFSVPAFVPQRLCLYMVRTVWISKAVHQHFILFRSLDTAFAMYALYLSMAIYSPFILPLLVYIENKASFWNGTRACILSFPPIFHPIVRLSLICYSSTAQSRMSMCDLLRANM